jgi:hypothetical protein
VRTSAAKFYGVEVTGEDVARAKAAGDANNDWKLTRRLIANAKPHADEVPSLEEVTAKFEEYYQVTALTCTLSRTYDVILLFVGVAVHAGRNRERQSVQDCGPRRSSSSIRVFSRSSLPNTRWELSLVRIVCAGPRARCTPPVADQYSAGRPRSDARKFLDHYGIGTYFKAVVCMEDTPKPKPDPAPVVLALQQLGVSSAVLIGTVHFAFHERVRRTSTDDIV